MPRTVTTTTLTGLLTSSGVSAQIVVRITISPTIYRFYGYKYLAVGANTIVPKILSITPLRFARYKDSTTIVTSCSIELADSDGDFESLMSQYNIGEARVHVYYTVSDSQTDFAMLFSGVIATPLEYDAESKVARFDVIPPFKSSRFPYVPLEGGSNPADSLVGKKFLGKAWPLILGRPIDVPAQQVSEPDMMVLATSISLADNVAFFESTDGSGDNPLFNTNQDSYLLDGELIGATWHPTTYGKLAMSNRNRKVLTGAFSNRQAGTYLNDKQSAFLGGGRTGFGLCFDCLGPGKAPKPAFEAYAYKQDGTRITWRDLSKYAVDATWVFDARRYRKNDSSSVQPAGYILRRTEANNGYRTQYIFSAAGVQADADVKKVRAYRDVPIIGGTGLVEGTKRSLVVVPTAYYTVNKAAQNYAYTTVTGQTIYPALIAFSRGLEYLGQGWDASQIYVSAAFNKTDFDHRNTAHQLKFLIETFTPLYVDNTSFLEVAQAVADWPTDFAILQEGDALDWISEIAKQARIGLILDGTEIIMRYLSPNRPSVTSGTGLNAATCLENPEIITRENREDIYAELAAKYRGNSYALAQPETLVSRLSGAPSYARSTMDFWIYQRRLMVQYSASWWLRQRGWGYRWLKLLLPRAGLYYMPYDIVIVSTDLLGDAAYTGTAALAGRIIELTLNPDEDTVELIVELPLKDGAGTETVDYWYTPTTPGPNITGNPFDALPGGATSIESFAVPTSR